MKISTICVLIASVMSFVSINANAVIITRSLIYDDVNTNIITGSNGLSYLGWGTAASLTYEQTIAATSEGGAFSGYHIANISEAWEFYALATKWGNDNLNGSRYDLTTYSATSRFGDNSVKGINTDMAWFLNDANNPVSVGNILVEGNEGISFNLCCDTIESSDQYSEFGRFDEHVTWLLVSDVRSVFEPSSLTLFCLGLLVFGCLQSKQKYYQV